MGTTSIRRGITCLIICLTLHGDFAWAHPGHGVSDPDGPAHYVLEPLHALPILLLALATGGVWGVTRVRRRAAGRRECRSDD